MRALTFIKRLGWTVLTALCILVIIGYFLDTFGVIGD